VGTLTGRHPACSITVNRSKLRPGAIRIGTAAIISSKNRAVRPEAPLVHNLTVLHENIDAEITQVYLCISYAKNCICEEVLQ
jgi:hypothetical protein